MPRLSNERLAEIRADVVGSVGKPLRQWHPTLYALLDHIDALENERAAVRVALSNHPRPECSEHPDADPISCGWKNAVIDVYRALGDDR